MRKILLIAAVMIIMSSAQTWAEGLNELVGLGKSMADINAAMDEETRAFNFVKAAVNSGAIRKGLSRASIKAQYGEPVIVNDDSATSRERWVYKPASSSFFKGIRICLLFDNKGVLDEINILQ